MKIRRNRWQPLVLAGVLLAAFSSALSAQSAEPPPTPKPSSFAPAEELVKQVQVFVADFEACLASEPEFADKQMRVAQNAHTLAVIAVALGLHDTDNALKTAAPALLASAQQLAKAKKYDDAKAALAGVQAAVAGANKQGPELKWNQKVASLGQLMKQAAAVDTSLRRNLRRFDQLAESNARSATLLALIAQAAIADTHEVKNPADVGKWYQMCADMRDAAVGVHTAIKVKDQAATGAAVKRLMQSCDDCHAVFHPE
jgi:hypothetical protein